MKGDFLIDGVSAYATYGVFVMQGGLTDIITLPSFKPFEVVDWLDDDGIDADLSNPVFPSRKINITFGFRDIRGASDFIAEVNRTAVHTFVFSAVARSMALRVQDNPSLSSLVNMGSFTLSFVQDTIPVPTATPYDIGATRVRQRGFLLDGIDLSQYGCWVLDGSLQNGLRSPAVKDNLTISSKTVAGQTYYGQSSGMVFKTKDLALRLLINARDATEFNRCYDALGYALSRPNTRTFKLGPNGKNCECYYKSLKCNRLEVCKSGTIWCELTLVLVMTASRPNAALGLLASENNYYIITEDGLCVYVMNVY